MLVTVLLAGHSEREASTGGFSRISPLWRFSERRLKGDFLDFFFWMPFGEALYREIS